ncbi:MAG TPA: glutamine-hydrolyzing GMP synthase [Clostridia bacterium]|jgi:GMP synthase (glutamine-hydrolysing)
MNQAILIIDFGGQYAQLIARRVREMSVYCEIYPYKKAEQGISKLNPKGIILSGGPNSVYAPNAPALDAAILESGIPVLGICYGAQSLAHCLGGIVRAAAASEYGKTETFFEDTKLFKGIKSPGITWMSHGDYIEKAPQGFKASAYTNNCPYAAMENEEKKIYAVQFHPEVVHTQNGTQILKNFIFDICGCKGDWHMEDYINTAIEDVRKTVGEGRIVLGLSGGVDSSVCAALLSKAIGKRLTCIFVDHGLMRKDEGDNVEAAFKDADINFVRVNAADRFYSKLKGVTDPEQKRKIIGAEFAAVFEEEALKVGADYLAQGTIYPDIIESGTDTSAVIKSHHNVGGLPKNLRFKGVIEPLRLLFKDEVRRLGRLLGLPESLVSRQPFPGPGLAARIIGEVTKDKADILREADAIFCGEIEKAGLSTEIHQYFAVLTSVRSVGVMGDSRTYDYLLALRGVTTEDFMTADFARIPYEVLEKVSRRIVNEVKGINRVVYDITTKPPATIEWE